MLIEVANITVLSHSSMVIVHFKSNKVIKCIFSLNNHKSLSFFFYKCLPQVIFASQGFLIRDASLFLRSGADQKPLASEDGHKSVAAI